MVFHLCLTNECQCNCFYCSQHVRSGRGEFLPEEHAVELAKKAFELGYDTIELTGGEPLLHPGFDRIIEKMGKDVPDIKWSSALMASFWKSIFLRSEARV